MNRAKIFLDDNGHLMPMEESDYEAESVLQEALEHFPDLMPGDQIDPESPRRWLLVKREFGVPGEESEAARWSLDHLFLDQDARPTFVECKRASDTRIRREVIAQMLDYAANGIAHWDMSDLRQAATETAQAQGKSVDHEISRLMGEDVDIDIFWQMVAENLKAGKVRLVFIADHIPAELRRIVEFLNSKMSDVEVLAIEIRQFRGENHLQRVLVPRVIGWTEKPPVVRPSREIFLRACPPATRESFAMILEKAQARGYSVIWGKVTFSLRAQLPRVGRTVSFAYGWPSGKFQIYLDLPIPLSERQAIRQRFMDFHIFRESGKHTLDSELNTEAISKLPEVCEALLDTMDNIVRAY